MTISRLYKDEHGWKESTSFGRDDAGRIIRKCRKAVSARLKTKGFRALIQDQAFLVTVLTSRQSKKEAIAAAYERLEKFNHPIRIEVVPELARVQ